MISDRIYDDLPHQMKNLNIIIPIIIMYFLMINIENALFFLKLEHQERCITTTLTNHKQCCS